MDMVTMIESSIADDSTIDSNDPNDTYGAAFDSYEITGHESMPRVGPKAVHQCDVCNKIFVSLKGLQQHAIIHTDQKPFTCDICQKSFRFKSNLFEHRSVHSGFTPHSCPYCGKTCRLKGNLKKHLKTHVTSKAELDDAWRPFASNRRPPADIPHDAIIVRSGSTQLFTPPTRIRKRKSIGLGETAAAWIEKIKQGEILPQASMEEKMNHMSMLLERAEKSVFNMDEFFNQVRALAFEKYECPLCKEVFLSRLECEDHMSISHPSHLDQRPMYCDTCIKTFSDRKSMEQHESYHKNIRELIESKKLILPELEVVLPLPQMDEDDVESVHENGTELKIENNTQH